MRSCEAIKEDLKAFVDGELRLLRRWQVSRHLARCEECRNEIAVTKRIGEELKSAEMPALSNSLRQKLLDAIPDTVQKPAPVYVSRSTKWQRSLALGGATAMALLAWVVFRPHNGVEPEFAKQSDEHISAKSLKSAGNPAATRAKRSEEKLAGGKPIPLRASIPPTTEPEGGVIESGVSKVTVPQVKPVGGTLRDANPEERPAAPAGEFHAKSTNMAFGGANDLMDKMAPESPETPKLYRTASLTLIVDGVRSASDTITKLTVDFGGVVQDRTSAPNDGNKATDIIVRVPVEKLDKMVAEISSLGEVALKRQSDSDLSKQINQQETHMRSQMNQSLAPKSNSSATNKLKELKDATAFATIAVQVRARANQP